MTPAIKRRSNANINRKHEPIISKKALLIKTNIKIQKPIIIVKEELGM